MLYQLSYQALGSKVVGSKGLQVLVLSAHSIGLTSLMEHVPMCDACGIWLQAQLIMNELGLMATACIAECCRWQHYHLGLFHR